MNNMRFKAVVLSCCLAIAGMTSFDISDAAVLIKTETSIAGAAISLEKCLENEDSLTAVKKVLFETESESKEEPITEEPTEETAETTTELVTEPDTEEVTEAPTEPVATEPAYAGSYVVSIAPNYLNVRTAPDENIYKVVGKMYNGAVGYADAEIDARNGKWYHVISGSVKGYVKAEFVITGDEAMYYIDTHSTLIGTVNDNVLNLYVRSGPSVDTTPITMISRGTQVVVVGGVGDFYQIQLDEACIGYVYKDYIDLSRNYVQAISINEERLAAEQAYEELQKQQAEAADQASRELEASIAQSEAESRAEEQERILAQQRAEAEASRLAAEEEARQQAIQASVQASIQASIQAAEEASRWAEQQQQQQTLPPETTPAPVVPIGVKATYVGGPKYAGQTVNGTELSILGMFSDGNVLAVDGWGCAEVGVPLREGTNIFNIVYQGFTCTVTVEALPQETVAPPQTPADPQADLRNSIVNYALQFVGNPYVYGGTNLVNGTDCSGFTMGVYAHFGINTTRTSRSQAVAGKAIDISQIKPGDLLFYMDYSMGQIGHVALYIGNGQIVHAANASLGIIISDAFYRQPCKAVTFL